MRNGIFFLAIGKSAVALNKIINLKVICMKQEWENFFETIKKAIQSCENASIPGTNLASLDLFSTF